VTTRTMVAVMYVAAMFENKQSSQLRPHELHDDWLSLYCSLPTCDSQTDRIAISLSAVGY